MEETDPDPTNGLERAAGSISKIPPDVCLTMLMNASVGRLAFVDDDGRQQLMPVNYAALDDEVFFRTMTDGPLSVLADGREGVAFGVDRYDERPGQGWNVTVRGVTSRVTDASVIDKVKAIGLPMPWAGGDRGLLIMLRVQEIDGRRVARS